MNMSLGLLDMASPAGEGVLLYLWATSACLNYPIVSFLYYITTTPRPPPPTAISSITALIKRVPNKHWDQNKQAEF